MNIVAGHLMVYADQCLASTETASSAHPQHKEPPVSITATLATASVADLEQATEFYARLFNRPADEEPMPTLAQWNLEPAGGVQVVEDVERSGSSLLTLLVTDLDSFVSSLHDRGIDTGEVISGVISRITQVNDPAGNTITFAELEG